MDPRTEGGGLGKPFRLLDLPSEIVLMILRLILVPGRVYPRPRIKEQGKGGSRAAQGEIGSKAFLSRNPRSPSLGNVDKRRIRSSNLEPGYQILATRKQILKDGAPLFYSKNVFYIPRGLARYAQSYFNTLLPEHRSLIRRVVCRVSATDFDIQAAQNASESYSVQGFNVFSPRNQWFLMTETSRRNWNLLYAAWLTRCYWICEWQRQELAANEHGLDEVRCVCKMIGLHSTIPDLALLKENWLTLHFCIGWNVRAARSMLSLFRVTNYDNYTWARIWRYSL